MNGVLAAAVCVETAGLVVWLGRPVRPSGLAVFLLGLGCLLFWMAP